MGPPIQFPKTSNSKKSYYHELRATSCLGEYLLDLCSRTYWSRSWIVQELILASSIPIKCGEAELAWSLATSFVTNYSAGYTPHLRVSRLDQGRPTMTVPGKIWKLRSHVTVLWLQGLRANPTRGALGESRRRLKWGRAFEEMRLLLCCLVILDLDLVASHPYMYERCPYYRLIR